CFTFHLMETQRAEITEKLKKLSQYMPGEDSRVYFLAEFLAERLGQEGGITPEGFNYSFQTVLYDIKTGVNSATEKPVSSELTGFTPPALAAIRVKLRHIAETVLPPDFYEEFIKVKKETEKSN
ncbi:MAG: hypothetical protein NTW30_02150, partial [Candidatus Aenigmarchaeota archaeon]|nr:hypothetical protein [Candidatus Aenigmarchaeota archaeon]